MQFSRRGRHLAVALALALTAPAGAWAAPEVEPNDDIFQMSGPFPVDGVEGTLATIGDRDVYDLVLRPQRQIVLRLEVTNPAVCNTTSFLGPRVGFQVVRIGGSENLSRTIVGDDIRGATFEEIPFTTPGVAGGAPERYALDVSGGGAGCAYRATIRGVGGGSTDAVDPTARPAPTIISVAEPDDLASQATGPMLPDVYYQGAIETPTDEDWLYARLRPGVRVSIELSGVGGDMHASAHRSTDREGAGDLESITLFNTEQSGSSETSDPFPVPSDGLLRVKVGSSQGLVGVRWRVRILPASAFALPVVPVPVGRGGSAGPDRLIGSAVRDVLRGLGGNDRIAGEGGNDRLFGGSGNDHISGGPGDDELRGGPGNDRLVDRQGRNVIDGGPGNDTIDARNGRRERVLCGSGRDRVLADRIDTLIGCEVRR